MTWQTLTEQQTLLSTDADRAIPSQYLIPLPSTRLLRVSGEEASSFLQNLLTNDVNQLQPGQAQLSGLCNPKGRLLSIFQLIRRDADYIIALPADLAEAIGQRLNMFKLRSKVDITAADDLFALGLVEPGFGPDTDWQGEQSEFGLMTRQPGHPARYLLLADNDNIAAIESQVESDWHLGHEADWQRLAIDAGLPMVFAESKEAFTPQQVNLDLVGGVSFKKGCYPGQEVVARLHYLGSPSRRLFTGLIHSDSLPPVNSVVTDDAGSTLGHLVQAQFQDKGKIICQLSMKLSAVATNAEIDGHTIEALTPLAEQESD
jgi:hypothetical protein